jgi:hypothetical protein
VGLLICALFLCISPCYGEVRGAQISRFLRLSAESRELVFIGVSPKLSNREDAVQRALMDAARKLSFFYSVSACSLMYEETRPGIFGSYFHFDYQLEYDEDFDKYLEALEYNPLNDIFEFNNAVFVITRTLADVSMPLFRGNSIGGIPPRWINEPPLEIGGFSVGVGYAGRFLSHRDTVVKSYENALIALIENIRVHLTGDTYNYDEGSGHSSITLIEERASGSLRNFYVIETWTDPLSLSVWTLAVADRGNQVYCPYSHQSLDDYR